MKRKNLSRQLWQCVCGKKRILHAKKNNQKWKTQIKSIELFIPGLLLAVGCLVHMYVLHTHGERYKHAWHNYLCCSLFLFCNWSSNFFNELNSCKNFCIVEWVLECCRKNTKNNSLQFGIGSCNRWAALQFVLHNLQNWKSQSRDTWIECHWKDKSPTEHFSRKLHHGSRSPKSFHPSDHSKTNGWSRWIKLICLQTPNKMQ